jgi:hypothetical protein
LEDGEGAKAGRGGGKAIEKIFTRNERIGAKGKGRRREIHSFLSTTARYLTSKGLLGRTAPQGLREPTVPIGDDNDKVALLLREVKTGYVPLQSSQGLVLTHGS